MNEIIHGDCLEVMQSIPDKSIDMILCDLPYGTTACKWDTVIPFEPLWEQYRRVIKDNGAIVLTASQPFTSALVMSNPKMFRYEMVWEKSRMTDFFQAKFKPMKSHENICVFYESIPTYNPIKWQIDERFINRRKSFKSHTETGMFSGNVKALKKDDGWRNPATVLSFKSENTEKTGHSTQKPVALFEYLIKTYTNENETVLDNCSGSGTTAIACINTNRNYICIEKDKTYFALSVERVNNHKRQSDLFKPQ